MSEVRWPQTKIRIPPSYAAGPRPRITARLDRAMQAGQVELILPPGGSGKTTAAAQWAAQTKLPVIWYAISATDRDLYSLLGGLAAATEIALPGHADRVRYSLSHGVHIGQVVEAWLTDIETVPTALVLDDLHQLDGVADIDAFIEALVRLKP